MAAILIQDLATLIASPGPASVTMLSGAGISAPGPASLPTGAELTERTFAALFAPGTLETILRHHAAVGWWSSDPCERGMRQPRRPRPPRLETVLGVAEQVYGYAIIRDVLADVANAQPNRLHRFFAAHLKAGGNHITANFDGCIEQAADADFAGWRKSGRIYHFHGSLAEDPSGRSLGATLTRIEGGFDDDQAMRFRQIIPNGGVLAIFGYSGTDFFDVDVALAALPPDALADLSVFWVAHNHDAAWHDIDPYGKTAPPLARHFRRAGATVRMICGPTDHLIAALARHWSFPDLGRPARRRPRSPVIAANEEARRAATFLLHCHLGLHDEAARVIRDGPLAQVDPVAVWQAQSEHLWEHGRWNDLRRMWRSSRVPAALCGAIRAERIGATLWVQGRLIPAYLWLSFHRRRCENASDRLLLAETEGRVVEHMARVPELRMLAGRLAPGMTAVIGRTSQVAGVHQYRRRNDLTSSLRAIGGDPREEAEAATSSHWFAEAGSIRAALSYRHRHYRDTYQEKLIKDGELATRYRELQAHYRSVGSQAGSYRTHLLPGAERVYSLGEVARGVMTLQYGWWHRIRLILHHFTLRVRYRLQHW